MNFFKDIKNRTPFHEEKISFDQIKYRIIDNKYNKLNNDFKIFLDKKKSDNKEKRNYRKSKNNLDVFEFIKNLFSKSTVNKNKIIKNMNINYFQKNFKRVLSSQEISIVRNSRKSLNKIFRDKNDTNIIKKNKKFFSRNKINSSKTLNNESNTLKYNNIIDNKIIHSTKSIGNFSLKYGDNKTTKKKNDIKLVSRFKLRNNFFRHKLSNISKTTIEKQNSNIYGNNNDISSKGINDKEFYINNNGNKSIITNNKNSVNKINKNLNNSNISEDNNDIYKKIHLKKLKISVDKYENSIKYIHNSDKIQQNSIDPSFFLRRKYIKPYELDNILFKDNKKELRRIFPSKNISYKLTRNKTPLRKEHSNSKSKSYDSTNNIMKKIDNIKKTIKIKKNILKIKKNNMKKINNISNYFGIGGRINIDKDIYKNLKIEIFDYHNRIGHFVYQDDRNVFSNHISYILQGDKIFKGI